VVTQGKPPAIRIALTDITERKRAEAAQAAAGAARATALAEAERLAGVEREHLARLGRDVVEMARRVRSAGVTPSQAEQLGRIEAAGADLLAVFEGIVDPAKIGGDKVA
jgi:hypothetical protein